MILINDVDPLSVCLHEGACRKSDAPLERFMTCDECDTYLRHVRNHLLRDIPRYVQQLSGPLYCENPRRFKKSRNI